MSVQMRNRLRRLESAAAVMGVACRECGMRPSEKASHFQVLTRGEKPDGPDLCPGCGRRRVFRIEFDRRG